MEQFKIDFIAKEFTKRGCKLLETNYQNAHQKLKYICRCGKINRKRFLNFRQGSYYCKECGSQDRKKKYRINCVKQYFINHECILLDDIYVDARTPMNYMCSCGTKSKICFDSFRRGNRCIECKKKQISIKNRKYTYEDVKSYFDSNGCNLLDSRSAYRGVSTLLRYACICGNVSQIRFSDFRKGQRCKECKNEKLAKKFRFSFDYVRNYFHEQDCYLLSESYDNAHMSLHYICSCGDKAWISFASFKRGVRCAKCGLRTGEKNGNYNPNRKQVAENLRWGKKCNTLVRMTYKSIGIRKTTKSSILLHYSPETLRNHIHNHQNWKFIKKKKWSIDHILPIKAFLEYEIYDIHIINALDNLQPMELCVNIRKGASYDKRSFEKYLRSKNITFKS